MTILLGNLFLQTPRPATLASSHCELTRCYHDRWNHDRWNHFGFGSGVHFERSVAELLIH